MIMIKLESNVLDDHLLRVRGRVGEKNHMNLIIVIELESNGLSDCFSC